MLRQSQFSTLLTPLIYHFFSVGETRVPQMRQNLFSVTPSTLSAEKGVGMGGMAPDAWDQYKKSGQPGELDYDQLYTQTYNHVEYPVRLSIEKRLIINDQYDQIRGAIRRAGMSGAIKQEIDAASLLNNAFAAGTTWSDGKSLCANDHPLSPNLAAGTQDNLGTDAFAKNAVSETRVKMMRFTDDKGNELGLMPNELWFPPELEDTAKEIAESPLDPTSGNNAINPQSNRWILRPWQRLSDTKNWFMTDSTWRQEVVKWYVREPLQIMMIDETTTHLVYELKLHYSFGCDDWRWIFGHQVS